MDESKSVSNPSVGFVPDPGQLVRIVTPSVLSAFRRVYPDGGNNWSASLTPSVPLQPTVGFIPTGATTGPRRYAICPIQPSVGFIPTGATTGPRSLRHLSLQPSVGFIPTGATTGPRRYAICPYSLPSGLSRRGQQLVSYHCHRQSRRASPRHPITPARGRDRNTPDACFELRCTARHTPRIDAGSTARA